MKKNEDIFKKYTRPLIQSPLFDIMPVHSFSFYHPTMKDKLDASNLSTIGDLLDIFSKKSNNMEETEMYIRNTIGIYSNFYVNQLMKQLNIISHLKN
jgi:hypothetical protein